MFNLVGNYLIVLHFSDYPRRGYAYYKGPTFLKDVYFAGFEKSEYYKSGAISWQLANVYFSAVYTSFENALFNFDDSVSHLLLYFLALHLHIMSVYFIKRLGNNVITKTCPCNIQNFFVVVKMKNIQWDKNDIFLFLLKTLIVGTRYLAEAVLTTTHNLCLGVKIRKIDIPFHTPVSLYKSATHNLCFGVKIRKIDIPFHTPVLLYKSGV